MLSWKDGYTEESEEYTAEAGILHIQIPAYGVIVLHHEEDK